jgi:hypothetical protein
LFLGLTKAWRAAFPQEADAKYAVAIALEMVGDPSALDTLRSARHMTKSRAESFRLGAAQVWLQVKFSTPRDHSGLRAAAALADSIIGDPVAESSIDPAMLASLAALRGKVDRAAYFYRRAETAGFAGLAPARAGDARALLTFASFGGPRDSHVLEERMNALAEQQLGDTEPWQAWAQRAQAIAFTDHQLRLVDVPSDYDLLRAQQQAALGHRPAVESFLQDLRRKRVGLPPNELAIDILLPEARLAASAYGPAFGIQWLDPALRSLRWTSPRVLSDVPRAAALVRAFALRAEWAAQMGDDSSARAWALCAAILWSDADELLQPVVQRMTNLSRRRIRA